MKIKETLEGQLALISERSAKVDSVDDICRLTKAMCDVVRQLQNLSGDAQGWLASVRLSAKELADICAGQYARVCRQTKNDRKKPEYQDKNNEPSTKQF